jgi:hypothetical protein
VNCVLMFANLFGGREVKGPRSSAWWLPVRIMPLNSSQNSGSKLFFELGSVWNKRGLCQL